MSHELTTLELHLGPLRAFLDDRTLTEIVINRPGQVMTEGPNGWTSHEVSDVSFQWCHELAKLIANDTKQSIDASLPLLSAQLPTGERIQACLPPIVPQGTASFTIRRPSETVFTLEELIEKGVFEKTRLEQSILLSKEERDQLEDDLPDDDKELLVLFRKRDWLQFFTKAVQIRKNIINSGQTGSGKTTFANALIRLIPAEERLITVEDVREARLTQDNKVSMVYSKDGKGLSKATPKQLFEANLRMRPDRVLPAELRGDETFFFLANVINTGTPGTITTVHANSAKLVFLRMSLMIKASSEGASLDRADILEMLYTSVDVVVQMERAPNGRKFVKEVYYDPAFARKQMG